MRRNNITVAAAILAAIVFGAPLFGQKDAPVRTDQAVQTDAPAKPDDKAQEKTADAKKKKTDDKRKLEDPARKFATACGIDFDQASQKTFINSDAKGWSQYTDATKPPELLSDDESLYTVRADSSGKLYVRQLTPGEDYDIYQDDCFRDSGKLEFFHFEFRTIWAWGYEEARKYDAAGKLLEKTSRFFDTRNEKDISEPAQAKDVAGVMKPNVHKTYGDMPFVPFFAE
ncbi:MAG TPA: hypothetical protein VN176_16040 [Verrucomicrobiae bacterium]|nr:hypothetical protein [Verrucomicrobiae bacterium]